MNQLTNHAAPAHLQNRRHQVGAAAVSGMGTPPIPYISIEEQRFKLVDAAGVECPWQSFGPIPHTTPQGLPMQAPYIDVVVVDVNPSMSKVYYADAYDRNAQRFMPPDCWSDNGVAPSERATNPQNDRCETCQWHKWGSKVNTLGNEVRACDDVKKIALYVPELHMNLAFLLRLKGSSHKNWRTYHEKVVQNSIGGRAADLVDVVTRVYFMPGQIGILNFEMVGLVDVETAAAQDQMWAVKATDSMIGLLDKPRTLPITHQPAAQVTHQPGGGQLQGSTQLKPQAPAAPAGFGGAQPQTQPTQTTTPAGFGGQPAQPTNGQATSELPPSGRPARGGGRGSRGPRTSNANAGAPQTQPQAPAGFGSGGAAQQPTLPTGGEAQRTAANPPAPQNFGVAPGAPLNEDLEAALNNSINRGT